MSFMAGRRIAKAVGFVLRASDGMPHPCQMLSNASARTPGHRAARARLALAARAASTPVRRGRPPGEGACAASAKR